MKNKCMISQPMNGFSEDDILETRDKTIKFIHDLGYDFQPTYFDSYISEFNKENETTHIPVAYLAKSIACMANCSAVYFCKGWEDARGCRIEHEVALEYGLTCIYEQ